MARKSARMVRANTHVIVIQGQRLKVTATTTLKSGAIEITGTRIDTGEQVIIRRTPGAKIDIG